MTEAEVPAVLMRKFVLRTTIWLLFLFGVPFAAAGTLDWLGAWIYFGLSVVITVAGGFWLLRRDPGLLEERLGSLVQRDQKGWDKIFMMAMLVLWVGWLVLIGLDAKRFHWSHVPFSAQMLGLALLLLATYVIGLTFRENSYAAPVIKIQKERGHQVVSTGPYAYVRHPMYGELSSPLLESPSCSARGGDWPPLSSSFFSSESAPCSRSAPLSKSSKATRNMLRASTTGLCPIFGEGAAGDAAPSCRYPGAAIRQERFHFSALTFAE
jgi:protein-S-isoprenylcysteine O-methyltransferase Ste14